MQLVTQDYERYLLSSMSFSLSPELDSEVGLRFFEEQVILAAEDWNDAKTRFAYHVHMILEHNLYRHALDDTGQPVFPAQKDYLAYLDQVVGRAVSTMKRDHGAIKMAKAIGLSTPQQIDEVGIEVLVDTFEGFKTDRDTGEPLGLKSGRIPVEKTPVEYARQVVTELSRSRNGNINLRRGDYKKELQRLLSPYKPIVRIERYEHYFRWTFEQYQYDGMLIFMSGDVEIRVSDNGFGVVFNNDEDYRQVPPEVMDFVFKSLKMA